MSLVKKIVWAVIAFFALFTVFSFLGLPTPGELILLFLNVFGTAG